MLQSKLLLRELASYQEHIKEEERKRIARDIHDELGQSLLALRIDVSMLQARTSTMHSKLNEKASDALNHLDTAIRSVRSIINDLRPPVLDLGTSEPARIPRRHRCVPGGARLRRARRRPSRAGCLIAVVEANGEHRVSRLACRPRAF